jgi:hypothetical protein
MQEPSRGVRHVLVRGNAERAHSGLSRVRDQRGHETRIRSYVGVDGYDQGAGGIAGPQPRLQVPCFAVPSGRNRRRFDEPDAVVARCGSTDQRARRIVRSAVDDENLANVLSLRAQGVETRPKPALFVQDRNQDRHRTRAAVLRAGPDRDAACRRQHASGDARRKQNLYGQERPHKEGHGPRFRAPMRKPFDRFR